MSKPKPKNARQGSGGVVIVGGTCYGFGVSVQPDSSTIPPELLQFEPGAVDIRRTFFVGTDKETRVRQIFCHTPLDPEEILLIEQLRELIKSSGTSVPDELQPIIPRLLEYAKQRHAYPAILRQVIAHIEEVKKWRALTFPLKDSPASEVRADLEAGLMYWCGRDASFRPLLVIRMDRMPKNMSTTRCSRLAVFCFEYGLRFLLLPGKVETFAVICDVRGVPVVGFPTSLLQEMIQVLSRQYSTRMHRMWIVNDSPFIQAVWKLIKGFLTEVQQSKIHITKGGTAMQSDVMSSFAGHQVEKPYGGLRQSITKPFYPFPMACGPFQVGYRGGEVKSSVLNCHEACDEATSRGIVWEHPEDRRPICWSDKAPDVFVMAGLAEPETLRHEAESPEAEMMPSIDDLETEPEASHGCAALDADADDGASPANMDDATPAAMSGISPVATRTSQSIDGRCSQDAGDESKQETEGTTESSADASLEADTDAAHAVTSHGNALQTPRTPHSSRSVESRLSALELLPVSVEEESLDRTMSWSTFVFDDGGEPLCSTPTLGPRKTSRLEPQTSLEMQSSEQSDAVGGPLEWMEARFVGSSSSNQSNGSIEVQHHPTPPVRRGVRCGFCNIM